jgi:hypothetical protein
MACRFYRDRGDYPGFAIVDLFWIGSGKTSALAPRHRGCYRVHTTRLLLEGRESGILTMLEEESNQPIKPRGPLACNFSRFVTNPARGLSLSRLDAVSSPLRHAFDFAIRWGRLTAIAYPRLTSANGNRRVSLHRAVACQLRGATRAPSF